MKNFNDILQRISQQKELSLVILIVLALGMMMIPIPSEAMDVIIAANICLTIIILMVVVYMNSPLNLSSFPSILLILTMLRIGVTVSTTRLILLNGDAGQIIYTFGEFVVGGNIVVGIIVFLIITIINFVVITKGAERVAEVSARFSLDAMPGRQMSIDSDLRANNITVEQAKQMRRNLTLESRLFGAMDGSMKFVKGDAIASMIAIVINLIGGLLIGMVQHGLSFNEALQTYSILTIGDGLVQQIPALVISLSSGMMITRVSHEDEEVSLGENVLEQLFKARNPLIAAVVILLIMLFIPGMPKWVFLLIIVALVIVIKLVSRKASSTEAGEEKTAGGVVEEKPTSSGDVEIPSNFESWKLAPIIIAVAENLRSDALTKAIKSSLSKAQNDILMDLGILLPNIILRYSDKIEKNSYQVLITEIPVANVPFFTDKILYVDQDMRGLSALDVDDVIDNTADFGLRQLGAWIPASFSEKCDEFSLKYISPEEFFANNVKLILKAHLGDFLGMQEVKKLIDKMTEYQDLIKEVLRMISLSKLTEILQRLIREDISIRNFKLIVDTILENAQTEKDLVVLTEYVRQAMSRYIVHKFGSGRGVINCVIVSEMIEDEIRNGIRFNNGGSYLSLDPAFENRIIAQLKTEFQAFTTNYPVIVTQFDIRRYLRSIVEKAFPNVVVLSYQEIEKAKAKLECLKVIDLEDDGSNTMFDDEDDD